MSKEQVLRDLCQLYPGQEKERLKKEYYRTKRRQVILIIAIGSLLALLLYLRNYFANIVSEKGEIIREELGEEQEIYLDATVGDITIEDLCVVLPGISEGCVENTAREEFQEPVKTEEELVREGLQQLLTDAEYANDEEIVFLPSEFEGKPILWKAKKDMTSLYVAILAVAAAVLVYVFADNDLHKQNEERRDILKKEYPLLLMKLSLYMEAGLPLRGAFCKIAEGYMKKEHPLTTELSVSCNALTSGVAESVVYEGFGRRIDMREYLRLSMLLVQNLRKGSNELRKRLMEEAQDAVADNLQYQKRRGEEAQTRLLLPMMALLVMVMVLIMIPAFYGVKM